MNHRVDDRQKLTDPLSFFGLNRFMDDPSYRYQVLSEHGPWAITEDALAGLAAGARRDVSGEAQDRTQIGSGALAVVPVMGPLTHRPRLFGGMSMQALASQVHQLSRHPDISTIVFDMDFPGGTVAGLDELAAVIRDVALRTIAVSNTLMASAAYYLASVTDEIVVAPSALTGSIGTVAMHFNLAGMLEQDGVKVTMISAGKGKTDMNPFEAPSESALVHEQALVDRFFHQFVDTVAKGRQAAGRVVTAGMIKRDWGARIYTAEQAVEIGMADRVATLDQVVAQLAGRPAPARTRAVSAVVSTEQTRRLNADRRRRARTRLALA